jgi:hypothetical protein
MMDAPMIDVVASLPLAAEMRDALVSRKGKRGLLLQCVFALETGEISDLPAVVEGAGDLYLESMMWANAAAESLLSAAAPSHAKSTPPPVSTPAPAPAADAAPASVLPPQDQPKPGTPQQGFFGRIRDTVLGWFGRRSVSHESA